jgi:hypothetical protein
MRDDRMLVCTSVGPRRIDHQRLCLESWLDAGFEVVSLNVPGEIPALAPRFPGVRFVATSRDGSSVTGRPVPLLYDAIRELASSGAAHLGLVNSDILLCQPQLREHLLGRSRGSLAIGQRIEVDSMQGANPQPQMWGIDLFFFDRALLSVVDERPFFFGVPWWDFWVPMAAMLGGMAVCRLEHGPLLHLRHPVGWSRDSWERGARDFGSFVQARLPAAHLPSDDNHRTAVERLRSTVNQRGALGHVYSTIVQDFAARCPILPRQALAEEPLAEVAFSEAMGYSIDRLLPGVSSHNNAASPFRSVPPPLLGKAFTQVVAGRVSPLEVEFRTAGRLLVLADTTWEGGRAMARHLARMGRREPLPPIETACNGRFEAFSVSGTAGARIEFPTQVMLASDRLSHAKGNSPAITPRRAPANGHSRVLVSAARRRCGAFSMFFQVLGHLRLAETQGLRPVVYFNQQVCYWSESGYNGSRNAWEYFFLPVAGLSMEQVYPDTAALENLDTAALRDRLADRAVVRDDYLAEEIGFEGRLDARQRDLAAALVERHVRIRPEILALAEGYLQRTLQGRTAIGVHYRGTDKVVEAIPPSFEQYRQAIDAELARTPDASIFAATDCARFLERLQWLYGERVVNTLAHRSSDGQPVHFGSTASAQEVLVDVLLLSRTRHLIHGVSNVSAAALVFNRSLPHTDLA